MSENELNEEPTEEPAAEAPEVEDPEVVLHSGEEFTDTDCGSFTCITNASH
jgi:hypothetical protein